MNKKNSNSSKPSVLSFEKKLVPSDALMYGTTWENRKDVDKCQALKVQEKSVRGTISNRLKSAVAKDPIKLNNEINKPNLQRVDACSLSPNQDTLKLQFTLKVLSGIKNPTACNDEDYLKKYQQRVGGYIEEHKFTELARRYAFNLASGRFLWRNRVGCDNIEVYIKALNEHVDFKQEDFENVDCENVDFKNVDCEKINNLADNIAKILAADDPKFLLLQITAYAKVGLQQDVYPSEELVLDKKNPTNEQGKKSKILYKVDDIAAMHSQKIGNAIRTIDTWYEEYNKNKQPIAADPYGAVTTLGKAFRPHTEAFFSLFDEWMENGHGIPEEQQHFVMAVLVRGGVFGESKNK